MLIKQCLEGFFFSRILLFFLFLSLRHFLHSLSYPCLLTFLGTNNSKSASFHASMPHTRHFLNGSLILGRRVMIRIGFYKIYRGGKRVVELASHDSLPLFQRRLFNYKKLYHVPALMYQGREISLSDLSKIAHGS